MKKFIKNAIVFSVPVFILLLVLEFLLRSIPNDYQYKKNYLDLHSKEIETLFLGSSHAFSGVDPQYVHSNSFNAAEVSQSLDYDLAILKKYEKRLDKLQYIVLPVDYMSLFNRLETGVEKWRVKNYTIYYGIRASSNINNYFEILNNKVEVSLKRAVKFCVLNKGDKSCSRLGWNTKHNSKNNRDLIKTGKDAVLRHTRKNNLFFDENVAMLKEIVAIAKEKNAKVIFYTTPAYKTYTSYVNKAQMDITIKMVQSIVDSNTNVNYYNFLKDTTFIATDFYDADHLNEKGAKKLSLLLDGCIRNFK